jgi:hypothetical protein
MGLLDRADGRERKITHQDLKALGFRGFLNENTLNYWFHGSGSSYIKISMSVNAREYKACGYVGDGSQVEKFVYCTSPDGSRYFIKSIESPTMDDLEVILGIVKRQNWR